MGLDSAGYAVVEAERRIGRRPESIAAGLSSPQRVCQERNMGDPRENLRQTAEFLKYALRDCMEVSASHYAHRSTAVHSRRIGFHGNATSDQERSMSTALTTKPTKQPIDIDTLRGVRFCSPSLRRLPIQLDSGEGAKVLKVKLHLIARTKEPICIGTGG